jgi:hypothetical protein
VGRHKTQAFSADPVVGSALTDRRYHMKKETKMTLSFFESLLSWQEQGNRSVEISISRDYYSSKNRVTVWIYDRQVMDGAYVSCPEEIPTPRELVTKRLRSEEAMCKRLLKKLETLEA